MNMNSLEILGLATPLVLSAAIILLLMVQRELAPGGGLGRRGAWLLSAGLGGGVLAFGLKLGLIALMAGLPEQVIGARNAAPSAPRAFSTDSLDRAGSAGPAYPARYVWRALPEQAPAPGGNPATPEQVALGKRLFFDKNLSRNGEVACASCHDLEQGAGADGRPVATGIDGQRGTRNAPTVWNAAFQAVLFWDGRAASLEEQAKGPLLNPLEMGMPSLAEVERRVAADPAYREAFARAFGAAQPIDIDRVAAAIAAYERTLITPDSPYDRFVRGERDALSAAQVRGMALFESVGCVLCHAGPNFSAAAWSEQGAPLRLFPVAAIPEIARYGLTEDTGLAAPGGPRGVWRVPSLRNVALTAPYFHNGAVSKLEDAVRIMAGAQLGRPLAGDSPTGDEFRWSDDEHTLSRVERRPLSEQDIQDLAAFLRALSGERLRRSSTARLASAGG